MGGEANKKHIFLVAAKIDKNNELSLLSFIAPKKFSGDVSFKVKDGELFLNIGKDNIKIDITSSKNEISSENTGCFSDTEDGKNSVCVSVHNK